MCRSGLEFCLGGSDGLGGGAGLAAGVGRVAAIVPVCWGGCVCTRLVGGVGCPAVDSPVVLERYGTLVCVGSSSAAAGACHWGSLGWRGVEVVRMLALLEEDATGAGAPPTATCLGGGPNEAGSLSVERGAEEWFKPFFMPPLFDSESSLPLPASFAI